MKFFYMHSIIYGLIGLSVLYNKQTSGIQVILTLVSSAVYTSVNPPPGPWPHHLQSDSNPVCNVEDVGEWSERTEM